MDYRAEPDRALEEMEWEDVIATLREVVVEMLGEPFNPPPSTSPLPALPPELGLNSHPQSVEHVNEVYGGCPPHQLGAAPQSFEQPLMATPALNGGQTAATITSQDEPLCDQNVTQSGQLYSQAGTYSQGQYDNEPVAMILDPYGQILVPVGVLNGTVVYGYPADRVDFSNAAVAPLDTSMTKKRKRKDQEHDDQPYIKKPLNAFMLFRKEQRPKVVAELNLTYSATVNTILGQRWKMLSKEEQAKYYEEAEKERLLHAQKYPGWSSSNNYGKKRKRLRCKAPTTAEDEIEAVTQEPEKLWVRQVQTAVMNPPPSQTGVTVAPHTETSVKQSPTLFTVPLMEAPHTQTAEMGFLLHRQL